MVGYLFFFEPDVIHCNKDGGEFTVSFVQREVVEVLLSVLFLFEEVLHGLQTFEKSHGTASIMLLFVARGFPKTGSLTPQRCSAEGS